jgi:uncharacterized protein YraI
MRIVPCISLAALALAVTVTVAGAQSAPALVISDLNLRAGPTQNSPSLGIIPGGSTIPAGPCGRGWCQAALGGQIGYVSQQYLDFGGPPPIGYVPVPSYAPPPPPPVYAPPPPPPPPYGPPGYYHDWRWSRRGW